MKRWRVLIAPAVGKLIDEQLLFIAADSIDNALEWEQRLRSAILKLSENPGYALDEEASDRLGFPVHKLVCERTYLIHYALDAPGQIVRVVGFRHGARLPRTGEP